MDTGDTRGGTDLKGKIKRGKMSDEKKLSEPKIYYSLVLSEKPIHNLPERELGFKVVKLEDYEALKKKVEKASSSIWDIIGMPQGKPSNCHKWIWDKLNGIYERLNQDK